VQQPLDPNPLGRRDQIWAWVFLAMRVGAGVVLVKLTTG
jgi:hypothetical protein